MHSIDLVELFFSQALKNRETELSSMIGDVSEGMLQLLRENVPEAILQFLEDPIVEHKFISKSGHNPSIIWISEIQLVTRTVL